MGLRIDPNARFDRQKEIAKQEQNAQQQAQQDAMSRRFAAMGRLNSGAAVKSEKLVNQQNSEALNKRLQGIQDVQEDEALRRQDIEDQRKFQTSERLGSQDFAATQADLGRKFQTSERMGSQDFASLQADIQRKYGTSEREAAQAFAGDEAAQQRYFANKQREAGELFQKKYVLSPQHEQFVAQLAQQMEQFQKQYELQEKQFAEDKSSTAFNKRVAEHEMNKKSLIDRIFENNFGGKL